MSLAERLLSLPLELEDCRLEPLSTRVPSGWTRHSTVVRLGGSGREGRGEDVSYGAEEQLAIQAAGPPPIPTGRMSLGDFCSWVEGRDLFAEAPLQAAYRDYRLWAFQSAALDLALRQSGLSIAAAVERRPRPLRFCASMGLGNPPSLARPRALREVHATLEFKLDAEPEWDDDFVGELRGLGGVSVVDLKGAYEGTVVDTPPDPALARRVATLLPNAIIEDPHRTPEVLAALEDHRERVSWDAPIHSLADLEDLPFEPRVLNIKPSRLGSIERLFALYAHCESEGIETYGGGQFELGVGRLQIQRLAALFHPDGPNDTAPVSYNSPEITRDLPSSPLSTAVDGAGL
ncbi:MAG: hypothetical protein KDC14_15105 [Planctomycetes bacterium]|nr:hypothetical protein [Planctomycetota bacterium]